MGRAIAIATPIFFALIGLEYAWGRLRGRNTYRLNDAVNSLSLGVLSQLSNLFTQLLRVGLYALAWSHAAIWTLRPDAWWVWVAGSSCTTSATTGIIAWDTRARSSGRRTSSITRARSSISRPHCVRPAAARCWAGCSTCRWRWSASRRRSSRSPRLIDLLYQYWIHTEHIGRLGWLDRILATPSNHRVHHAVNDRYLDRNYGGILDHLGPVVRQFRTREPSAACTARAHRSIPGTRSGRTSRSTSTWRGSRGARRAGATKLAGLVQAAGLASGRR